MSNKTATKRKRLLIVRLFAIICITLNLSDASALKAGSRCNRAGGAKSYEKFCASCHHSLEQSDRKGRSASRIGSALKHLGVHGQLAYLKKEVVESIACVLATPKLISTYAALKRTTRACTAKVGKRESAEVGKFECNGKEGAEIFTLLRVCVKDDSYAVLSGVIEAFLIISSSVSSSSPV